MKIVDKNVSIAEGGMVYAPSCHNFLHYIQIPNFHSEPNINPTPDSKP